MGSFAAHPAAGRLSASPHVQLGQELDSPSGTVNAAYHALPRARLDWRSDVLLDDGLLDTRPS